METFEGTVEWAPYVGEFSHCDLTKNSVIKRIGSDSSYGIVFEVVLNGKHMACKVIPINTDNDKIEAQSEIITSYYFGEKYPNHFAKIYGYTYCSNIIVDRKILQGSTISLRRKFSSKRIEGYLLFMELGRMDMNYWIKEYHSFETYVSVLIHLLEAIQILDKNNIKHDLHMGNIIFMENDIPKIIDFGYIGGYDNHNIMEFRNILNLLLDLEYKYIDPETKHVIYQILDFKYNVDEALEFIKKNYSD